jgi:hypothetical protein
MGGNGGYQVTLTHAGSAGDTQLAGEGLQLGELKAGKAAALGGCCRQLGSRRYVHSWRQLSGFGHEGSFPLDGVQTGSWTR